MELDHWQNLGIPLATREELTRMRTEGEALRQERWRGAGIEVNGEAVAGAAMRAGYRDGIEPGLPIGSKRMGYERIA